MFGSEPSQRLANLFAFENNAKQYLKGVEGVETNFEEWTVAKYIEMSSLWKSIKKLSEELVQVKHQCEDEHDEDNERVHGKFVQRAKDISR